MAENKTHDHEWLYDHRSCCYVLCCRICPRQTTVHHVEGEMPKQGQRVLIKEDGRTMVAIPESGEEEG